MRNYDNPAAFVCYLSISSIKNINNKLTDEQSSKILDRFIKKVEDDDDMLNLLKSKLKTFVESLQDEVII